MNNHRRFIEDSALGEVMRLNVDAMCPSDTLYRCLFFVVVFFSFFLSLWLSLSSEAV